MAINRDYFGKVKWLLLFSNINNPHTRRRRGRVSTIPGGNSQAIMLGLDIVGELVVWVECSVGVGAIKRAKGATAW